MGDKTNYFVHKTGQKDGMGERFFSRQFIKRRNRVSGMAKKKKPPALIRGFSENLNLRFSLGR
jgi:hypothetical protein